MARPLRLEFPGALYHVTSRGDRREDIYDDDTDKEQFLSVLGKVCSTYNWGCHAYCLMSNHYHLLIETPDGNLSKGMRQLNGIYTQVFNRRHARVGHVFQGRYKAILVDKDSYLLELARYIVLNPVRAGMVRAAKDWPWSSCRATSDKVVSPSFLSNDWLLSAFSNNKRAAIAQYEAFVAEGKGQSSPWHNLRQQVYLGNDDFVERMQTMVGEDKKLDDIPALQKRPAAKPIEMYKAQNTTRNETIVQAYASGGYTLKQIGDYFGLHYSTVSGIVKNHKSKT